MSAAHCSLGFSGDDNRGPFSIDQGEKSHLLEVVEHGAFSPQTGIVEDWMLLRPVDGADALAGVETAVFATTEELEQMVDTLSTSLDDQAHAVWTLTFPARSMRTYPRTPLRGDQQFASRGFLKSDLAYRDAAELALQEAFIFDDRAPVPLIDAATATATKEDETWETADHNPLRGVYQLYHQGDSPIIYHSADYAPGSSGGGVFHEESGKLLGFIPMGSSLISRKDGYAGFGQLYRIDFVCRESSLLKTVVDECK